MKNQNLKKKTEKPTMAVNIIAGVIFLLLAFGLVKCVRSCNEAGSAKPVFDHNEAMMFVEMAVKQSLNDPSSYEFVDHKYSLVDAASKRYRVNITYRAKNAFGGVITKQGVYEIDTTYIVLPVTP